MYSLLNPCQLRAAVWIVMTSFNVFDEFAVQVMWSMLILVDYFPCVSHSITSYVRLSANLWRQSYTQKIMKKYRHARGASHHESSDLISGENYPVFKIIPSVDSEQQEKSSMCCSVRGWFCFWLHCGFLMLWIFANPWTDAVYCILATMLSCTILVFFYHSEVEILFPLRRDTILVFTCLLIRNHETHTNFRNNKQYFKN